MTLTQNKYFAHLCQPRFLLCTRNKNLAEPDWQLSELARLPLHPWGFAALHELNLSLGLLTDFGCLGSIGEILFLVTVMKTLNTFFKH